MNVRSLSLVSLLALLLVSWPAAAPRYMTVDEVRPGMVGVGRTVFEGDKVEEFKVNILGVLKNVTGPRRNLVLARLEGGPLAHTGVIAGMSGSPVYVDGRLLGAVAFSLGQFSKEPIAGITPIAEMVESAGPQARRLSPERRPALQVPMTRESMTATLRQAFSWFQRPFADRPEDILVSAGLPGEPASARLGTLLRPIATPLALGGFTGEVADTVSQAFSESGFVPSPAASPQRAAAAGAPPSERAVLRPGDAVGVNLITGDLTMGGTGTVTEVDGDQVYAFGHPLYNLGPTQFPMTRAYVYTLLPSLSSSMKVATTGETIGTFRQDRATAIAGTLGRGPDLIPINITLDTERGLKKTFKFQVVNDQLFTPLLTYVSIVNTLTSYEREYGAATFAVKGKAVVRKHGQVAFEDVFTGDSSSPSVGAAASVVAPLAFLLGNDIEPVELDAVDLTITTSEQPRTATLERVWLDAVKVKPGTTVPLKLLLRTYRGEELTRTVPIDIPANATGGLSLLVSDGANLARIEQRDARSIAQARGLQQLIRELNRTRKNNRLYIRLMTQGAGGVVNGEKLSSLPPSILEVMEADRNGGSFSPLRNATIGEWEVTTDNAVSGSRILTIDVEAGD